MAIAAIESGFLIVWCIWCITFVHKSKAENTSVTTSSPSPTQHWIQTPVPLYYMIAVGVVLFIILIVCSVCLVCLHRQKRRNQACINNGKHDISKHQVQQHSVSFNKTSTNGKEAVTITNQGTVDKGKDNDNAHHKKKNEGDELNDETMDHVKDTDLDNPVWVLMDEEQVPAEDTKNGKRTGEPVYAQISKQDKTKPTNKPNVVYAELASFDTSQDSQGQEKRLTTDYAEITPLNQSLRDMSYLQD